MEPLEVVPNATGNVLEKKSCLGTTLLITDNPETNQKQIKPLWGSTENGENRKKANKCATSLQKMAGEKCDKNVIAFTG